MHARLPKNFVLEERLTRYAPAIELAPTHLVGHWAQACWPLRPAEGGMGRFDAVHLDLGCGKGAYLAARAKHEPGTLFVGVDAEPICVAYTAQAICEQGLTNAVVVPAKGDDVCHIFGPGELTGMSINFPTPFPRKREAGKRLVILERLLEYRHVLAPGAQLVLRTDSLPLFRFALTQLKQAGYKVDEMTEDASPRWHDEPITEYERRLRAQGARVMALLATPGTCPTNPQQSAELSLVAYLPDDLESLDYVPHGMQGTVTNLRNRKRNASART